MKKLLTFLLITAVIAVILNSANPSKDDFINYASNLIKDQIRDANYTSIGIVNNFIASMSGDVINQALDYFVVREDYYICSVYTINEIDTEHWYLGIGNKFFTFNN